MFKLREIPISKWLIVTSVLLSTVALHGQSLDSLRLRPDNRAKVDAYQRLATEMEPHRKVLQILDEAYRIAVDLKYSSGQAQNRWLAGEVAFQLKRWDASKEAYEAALRIYQQKEDISQEIKAYERIALVESKAGHYTLAAQYIQKANLLKERQATTQAQETISSLQQQDTAMQKEMAVQQVQIQGLNVEKSRALEQLQAQRQLSLEQQLEMARLLRERDSLELDRLGLEYDNLSQELSLEKAQRRNTWTLIGAIMVGLLSLLFWQRLRIGQARKNVQLERQRAAYLKQVNDLKDQFLANTSHELKTPLNGIIGLAESLLDEDTWADRNERDHNIELIVNSGRRLSNLVNDLLDFSKIRNNALELNPVSIDLHALVDVVVRIYRYMVKDKPLEVRNLIGKEMPAVLADEDRLQQILHNLIGNAVKFTEKGTIDVTARILDAGWVEIAVTDTGIGIPEDKQQSIFEAFVQ
ncbi:MAG: hypothetical protein KDC57_21105, partial [Saprospiraceae bacterium]|nr:hypothetical protein [Saprospiraceae bacterium]